LGTLAPGAPPPARPGPAAVADAGAGRRVVTRRLPRAARLILAALTGLLVLLVLAVLASATLDRPSKTIQSEVTIDASRETVWRILTDFEGYSRWNPLMTTAAGDARLGAHIQVDLRPPDGDTQELSPEITILRPNRKLAWMSRQLVPGVSDREYEVIIEPLGEERVRVLMHKRFEGILIPMTSTAEEQVGLDLMAEALEREAEEATPGTTIRTTESWECDRPLEQYGDLPIIVKSRIDHQAQPIEAVTLSGPDCAGDGDPETIDLVLEIQGDGIDVGPRTDAVRVKLGAHDIEIEGYADCAAAPDGVRQNGIHVMLGYRITFVGFRIGDPDAGEWTCDGASGALAIEERSEDDPEPEDVVCVGCEMVSSNRGLYIGDSIRSGSRNSTFVAPNEILVEPGAEDPVSTGNTWRRLEP
ncbi:MAG: SRPBCC family protein, partial [Gaiellaceae bacterium]